jgi:4-amino-4-deoxy-L-arabinose transferase-like glycosyltransferase
VRPVSDEANPLSARSRLGPRGRAGSPGRTVGWTVATAIVVLVGIAFRWVALGSLSLWFDEGYAAWITGYPDWAAILHFIRADTAPPLYYIMLQSWSHIFGASEWGLRSLSAAASTATVLVVWAISERTLRSGFARFVAVALVALSSLHIQYAQEARGYALLGLFEAVTIYCIVRRIEGGGFGFVLAAAICQTAAVYTQNIMLFYAVAIVIAWCIWPVPETATRRLRPSARRRLWRRRHLESRIGLRDAAIAGTILTLLYIPWLPTLRQQAHAVGSSFWVPAPTVDYVVNVLAAMFGTQAYWEFTGWLDTIRVGSRPLMLYASLTAGCVLISRGLFVRRRQALPLLVCGWLPIGIALVYSCFKTSIFLDKAFIASIPPISLLMALPVDALVAECAAHRFADRIGRVFSIVGTLALLALLVPTLIGYVMDRKKEDWRSAGQYVAALPAQLRLIEFDANDGQPAFDYYYNRYRNPSAPRPIESGVPIGFLEQDPPRAMQRVLAPSDLANLIRKLSVGRFLEVDLVTAHLSWSDPDNLAMGYMSSHAKLIAHWQSPDKQIDVWRFLVIRSPSTRSTTRAGASTRSVTTRQTMGEKSD